MTDERQKDRTSGIDVAHPGIVVFEPDKMMIVGASPNFVAMIGYKEDEMPKMNIRVVHPGDIDALMRGVNRARRDGMALTTGLTCRARDGYHIPADIHFMRLSPDGRLIVGVIVPIDRNPPSEPPGPLTFLTIGIAHDVNNLLSIVRGSVELLPTKDPEDSELLKQITISIQKAGELMRRFMRVVRADKTDDPGVELLPHLRDMEVLLRSMSHGAEFEFKLSDGLSRLPIGKGDLDQLMLNLVANARDAAGQGGRIVVEAFPATVPDGWTVLRVRDSGPGVPEELVGRVVDPYFTTKSQGTGVGLTTVLAIARKGGGTLEFFREAECTVVEARFPPSANPFLV